MKYLEMKKRAFLSIINSIKGFVRTITGTPPLTLPDCVDNNSLINYSIMGNCVQDGTPSVDNPIEVKCTGEKTKNLCDSEVFSNWITSNGGWYESNLEYAENRKCIVFSSNTMHNKYVPELFAPKEATQYTWSMDIKGGRNSPTQGALSWGFVYTDDTTTSVNVPWDNLGFKRISVTSAAGKTVKSLRFSYTTASYWAVDLDSIQVEERAIVTDYEPFGKYKIPIVASGKNLFNTDEFVAKMQSWGVGSKQNIDGVNAYVYTIGWTHGRDFSNAFTGEEGIRYRFSMRIKALPSSATEGVIYYGFAYTDGTTSYNNTKFAEAKDDFITVGATSPSGKTVKSIALSFGTQADYAIDLDSMQIEEGTTQTDYEPFVEPVRTNIYLDEPLRAIGNYKGVIEDYKDYIQFEDKKIYRKIIKVNNWLQTNTTMVTNKNSKCLFMGGSGARCIATTLVYCPIFKGVNPAIYWNNTDESIMSHITKGVNNYVYYAIKYERLGLVKDGTVVYRVEDETKTALTDAQIIALVKEYFASNFTEDECSIYVCDYRGTVEETIELPKLPTFKGTTIYKVDTETQPSNMSATYYSTRKGE